MIYGLYMIGRTILFVTRRVTPRLVIIELEASASVVGNNWGMGRIFNETKQPPLSVDRYCQASYVHASHSSVLLPTVPKYNPQVLPLGRGRGPR